MVHKTEVFILYPFISFCEIDISPSFGKFYAQFNSLMAVLGKYSNEMAAVRLIKSYCVPSLLYACGIWSLKFTTTHSFKVALNSASRKIFNCCWWENPELLFYCKTLPVLYCTIDQHRILFYIEAPQQHSKKSNCHRDTISIAAKY